MKIVYHIKQLRAARGYTIRRLSALSGVSKTQINKIEMGMINPTLKTMCLLAQALDVEITSTYEIVDR